MNSDLRAELEQHQAEPFPDSVGTGECGQVDTVLIGADIYCLASRAGSLDEQEIDRLRRARDRLDESISEFPREAHDFYRRLVRIAELALLA